MFVVPLFGVVKDSRRLGTMFLVGMKRKKSVFLEKEFMRIFGRIVKVCFKNNDDENNIIEEKKKKKVSNKRQ